MPVNQQVLQGNWNEIVGRIRRKWGQLSRSDLERARGSVDELVGVIQQKTGLAGETIRRHLQDMTEQSTSFVSESAEAVRERAERALHSAERSRQQAAEAFRSGYAEAERFVQERPAESLAVCFGAGLITGVIIGFALRS